MIAKPKMAVTSARHGAVKKSQKKRENCRIQHCMKNAGGVRQFFYVFNFRHEKITLRVILAIVSSR
jgi:hypothetical protein